MSPSGPNPDSSPRADGSSEPDIPPPDLTTLLNPAPPAHPAVLVAPGLTITRLIGRGGQALVFEAIRDQPRQVVAVKIARPDCDQPTFAARADLLRREAELLANLTHPNIVRVFDIADASIDGRSAPCVVMELIEEARTLTAHARHAGLSQAQRVELIIKVARAVQHIHERLRAFHRDLKPGNILVGRDGEPRIIDLGLAVSGDTDHRLAERGSAVGTPDYMAPEQFDRDPAFLTQRTDVYALGVLLHELLTDEKPYDLAGLSAQEKEGVILNRPPRDIPPERISDCPDVGRIVRTALRKEHAPAESASEQRWATPGVFADQLQQALGSPRGAAPPAPTRPRFTARHALVRSALALILALICSAAGLTWGDSIADLFAVRQAFQRSAFQTVPPAVQGRPFTRSAVTGFQSLDEVRQAADLLRKQDPTFPDVDPERPATWRPIYTQLLRRLRDSGVDAVTFDIVFGSRTDHDADFAAAARDSAFPVIVGLDLGHLADLNSPDLNTTILSPPVLWGGVSLIAGPDAAWAADLVFERDAHFTHPMLSVRTLAAVCRPGADHRFSLAPDGRQLRIDAVARHSGALAISRPTGEPLRLDSIESSDLRAPSPEEMEDFGLRASDRIAQMMLALPDQPVLDAATVPLLTVVNASPGQLRTWFARRAVFVANMTPLATDHFDHPDGRQIWGVYGHAVAYEALMTGKRIRSAPTWLIAGIALSSALIPLLLLCSPSIRLKSRVARALILTLAISAILIFAASIALRHLLVYIPPFATLIALLAAAPLGFLAALLMPSRHSGS